MTEIATRESQHTLTINVVEVGKGRRYVELPEGSLGDTLLRELGGSGRRVTAGGVEVRDDTPLRDGMTACVGPKSVKQGS